MTNANAATAQELDRQHWLRGAPEEAASFKYDEEKHAGSCPACSTIVPEKVAECPECGLVVNPEANVSACPDCDAEVGDEVSKCPKCGAEFE